MDTTPQFNKNPTTPKVTPHEIPPREKHHRMAKKNNLLKEEHLAKRKLTVIKKQGKSDMQAKSKGKACSTIDEEQSKKIKKLEHKLSLMNRQIKKLNSSKTDKGLHQRGILKQELQNTKEDSNSKQQEKQTLLNEFFERLACQIKILQIQNKELSIAMLKERTVFHENTTKLTEENKTFQIQIKDLTSNLEEKQKRASSLILKGRVIQKKAMLKQGWVLQPKKEDINSI